MYYNNMYCFGLFTHKMHKKYKNIAVKSDMWILFNDWMTVWMNGWMESGTYNSSVRKWYFELLCNPQNQTCIVFITMSNSYKVTWNISHTCIINNNKKPCATRAPYCWLKQNVYFTFKDLLVNNSTMKTSTAHTKVFFSI